MNHVYGEEVEWEKEGCDGGEGDVWRGRWGYVRLRFGEGLVG